MAHLIIWSELANLLQYMRYGNAENLRLMSCTDWVKLHFKVSKVRLKASKLGVQSKFIWFLEIYISGITNLQMICVGVVLEKVKFIISKQLVNP